LSPPGSGADAARYAERIREAIALGSPGVAFDLSAEARGRYPDDPEFGYLAALALANGGSGGQAARLLRELLEQAGEGRADVLSLAGRVAKERWSRLPAGAERDAAGALAKQYYGRAFFATRDWFPGINAATMCMLTGQAEEGRRLAAEVRSLCAAGDPGRDFWLSATLGEANLLLGEQAEAERCYRVAVAAAGRRYGDIASMRRQLKLLSWALPHAAAVLARLPMPRVAVFTGHMIDAPDRAAARFPGHIETAVAAAIADAIRDLELGFGYCSAACGADILFAERMLDSGSEVDIVLPFRREDFLRSSVAYAGADWVRRFDRVLERAASISYCVEESHLGDDVLYAHAADQTAGLAVLRAAQLESEAILLAVAEPGDEGGVGGTAANVRRWQSLGRRAEVLDLRSLRAAGAGVATAGAGAVVESPTRPQGLPWGRRQIRTMLFADMVGYSKLREHQTPRFFVHFLGALERTMEAVRHPPVFGNTWGDGLYLVFEQAAQGAAFALHLRDEIARIDWNGAGLPADMAIRIGMHTGPVFRTRDPIIRQDNFFGSHVTRAARIEPIAAPGSIYLSEQMAAALAASGEAGFACDYLGPMQLAKQFAVGRIYRLRRSMETE
jgi:class 3 adenylate cyclase